MKRASIDIGSNSILLLAADIQDHKISSELINLSEVTALGKDLDKNSKFIQSSMDDSFAALKKYKNELEKIGLTAEETIVTATEASRVATNSAEFYSRIKDELGFKVSIISANGEAHYSALGAALDIHEKHSVIMDIGGASTELIKIQTAPFKVIDFISMPMGSVRGTDWIKNDLFDQKVDEIFLRFIDKLPTFNTDLLCCVAGTMTSFANMFHGKKTFEEDIVHGTRISQMQYGHFLTTFETKTEDELKALYPFLSKRARTIVAGAKIGLKIAQKINVKDLEVSTYGLRYGTIISGGIASEFISQS